MKKAVATVFGQIPLAIGRRVLFRTTNLPVLAVEDADADAYLIRRALIDNPKISQVVLAKDGVEALQMIDQHDAEPDVAVIDLHMPRKDGFALLRELSLSDRPQFPAIVLTSSVSTIDIVRSWKRGAVKFLTKPNSIGELAAVLDNAIAQF